MSIKLEDISTKAPKDIDKKEAKKQLALLSEEIGVLSEKLYAEGKQALLIVFQGMDSSGKDSSVRNSFAATSPIYVETHSFKKPTEEEMNHDFLWRVSKQAPQKGSIKVFLRSHYEDILIQRVHKWIDMDRVKRRMKSINAWEDLISYDNNTTVLKFYLHLSFEQQEEELRQRVDEAEKHWKHNDGDWEEREHWDKYREAYEYVLNESEIPWHIIPVDDRWYKNYIIAKTIRDTLADMDPKYPGLETEKTWTK